MHDYTVDENARGPVHTTHKERKGKIPVFEPPRVDRKKQ